MRATSAEMSCAAALGLTAGPRTLVGAKARVSGRQSAAEPHQGRAAKSLQGQPPWPAPPPRLPRPFDRTAHRSPEQGRPAETPADVASKQPPLTATARPQMSAGVGLGDTGPRRLTRRSRQYAGAGCVPIARPRRMGRGSARGRGDGRDQRRRDEQRRRRRRPVPGSTATSSGREVRPDAAREPGAAPADRGGRRRGGAQARRLDGHSDAGARAGPRRSVLGRPGSRAPLLR